MSTSHGRPAPSPDREHGHDAAEAALRRAGGSTARPPAGLVALQRHAGNAAVGALLAGKVKFPGGDKADDIDRALAQIRGSDPDVPVVEKGLKAAKEAGVPVDIDGADQKPPASALAVTRTGFGPEQVPAKKPPAAPKPTAASSPLGKAAAKPPRPAAKGKTAGPGKPPAVPRPAAPAGPVGSGGGALSADKLLEPPAPPERTAPGNDPAFAAVAGHAKAHAAAKKDHAPPTAKAGQAQGAALAPADDTLTQGQAAKVETMDAQPAGSFDKKAFIEAVKAAITAKTPSTLEQADAYKESGKAGEVKGEVKGLVGQGKDASTQDVAKATEAPPDTSKAVAKEVTPLVAEQPGAAGAVPATGAAPKPAPAEQVNLEAGKHQADSAMAEGGVSEQQLAKGNEPEFEQALADKKTAADHASSAPQEFRAHEQTTLAQSRAGASEASGQAVAGMHGAKAAALNGLAADQGKAKSKDEQQRAAVTARIQEIYTAAEKDVHTILEGIDPKVEAAFEKGEAGAKAAFEQYVEQKMSAYKKDRYGGWLGGLRWAKDKLVGMPDKVNEFFAAGRELYLKQMDGVISNVADIVAVDLGRAKQRIAAGKAEIATYVKSLPQDLAKVGAEAADEIGDRFASLEEDVNSKQEALVDTLATKYVEARQGLDDRIEEMQAANKGLVDKAIGAIKAVVNTIKGLVSMLTSVLAKAASVVDDIISDPIGFLGNLIAGVKGGILRFKDNILEHLKKGLMGWLFGALAEGGVELPETFDLKGILKLVASIFGLTWANIRNRVVRKIGDKAMGAIESGVEIFKVLSGPDGLGGLWQMVLEKVGDLKATIMEKVEDFVITRVITAGITWLISLLNPAAAFIKACKLIYDVVMFFVNNGERIMAFVNTVLDSVADIVRGNVGGVVAKIENVLGQMVPILISFLASVLGLGNIGAKIREIVQSLQRPVNKALDWVIGKGLKLAGPIIRGIKGLGAKAKAGAKRVKDKALAKVKAGARAVGEKLGLVKASFSMKGESHTLTRTADGDIQMASRNPRKLGPLFSAVLRDVEGRKKAVSEAQAKAAQIRSAGKKPGKRDQALLAELDKYVAKATRFLSDVKQIDAVRGQIERSRAKNPKSLLTKLGNMLESLGARFDLKDLGPLAPPPAKEIGAVEPYDELKKGRVNELGTGEAEHVTPGAVLENFVRGWSATKLFYIRGQGADSVYKRDITLLIPKRMADIKTDLGAAGEASDQKLIRQVKDAMQEARAIHKSLRGGKPNKSQKARLEALAASSGSLNTIVTGRAAVTIAARKQYVKELRSGQDVGLPPGMKPADAIRLIEERCSDGRINQAALEQLANAWSLDPLS